MGMLWSSGVKNNSFMLLFVGGVDRGGLWIAKLLPWLWIDVKGSNENQGYVFWSILR